jgi:hypothetical protein
LGPYAAEDDCCSCASFNIKIWKVKIFQIADTRIFHCQAANSVTANMTVKRLAFFDFITNTHRLCAF